MTATNSSRSEDADDAMAANAFEEDLESEGTEGRVSAMDIERILLRRRVTVAMAESETLGFVVGSRERRAECRVVEAVPQHFTTDEAGNTGVVVSTRSGPETLRLSSIVDIVRVIPE